MEKLIAGLHRFQAQFHQHKELFDRLSQGQRPEALLITCSDSRINPNMITQTDPGDLFILRNAGNIIPPYGAANGGEGATIEFAVAGLGVKHVVVCGHSLCGAMNGLLEPERLKDMPAVQTWLSHAEATRRIVNENYPDMPQQQKLNVATQENVLVQLENLRTHPVIASRLSRGDLTLHAWMYKIETGDIFSYQVTEGQFLPLTAVPEESIRHRPRLEPASTM